MDFNVYNDIEKRTKGEIYIGVVGPVRTGKSTFIKNFMDVAVMPNIKDENEVKRAMDELPQSSAGKTIMTTEPKFIPNKAVTINIGNKANINVRLIDCVGFMVDGATGHMEEDSERMVKTPWFEQSIPFSKAADLIQISPVIHNRIVCPEYIVEISIYPPDGIQVEAFSIKDRNQER